ncbi:MAG: T9SS type A sorting domain-containing protein [Bacteroidetes bacterium]|nr:T9SS type A sorting domain-containing protein [Bacteroidota bacterium]MBP6402141.1 T9SS type A sorting domain-containing protein [Bacteroidia bacterium]MBK6840224.1 T9SS type A sorting domain-containing protein [Bacteroidota bacterium]MBK9524218.1 T9SS type A sorting domain-containing protein [Bacteroidota bacterium]MBK9541954.1 T9SS type A sorting domain-containing protein [Bacteroidota bacterium]
MKKKLLHVIAIFLFSCSSYIASAQFNSDSSQTYFVCNATGAQSSVSSFGDGFGGTYSFWLDKRNGLTGTAIYGQHMDSLGNPEWAANGQLFFQENAKEVWLMKAIAWQNGILLSWVQGGFGIGGDTLYCNYYDANGSSQWAQPVVVGNKQGNIIYVSIDNLDIFPNDSGATVTFGLTQSGGSTYFSYNRIDFNGNLRWPLDSTAYYGNGYYYQTASDNFGGFYIAASTGGIGTHIYVGHIDFDGNSTISSPVDICGTVGGRNNSPWKVVCDSDTNAYVIWANNPSLDISLTKIEPDGTLSWGGPITVCSASGTQENPDMIMHDGSIYAIWNDGRPGANFYYIYMQKLDTSGTAQWSPDGILLSDLPSNSPSPKVVGAGSNVVGTYIVNSTFRAQQVRPDSSLVWHTNGVVINVNNLPYYADYNLVSSTTGSVTAIWKENGDNICATRVQPNGILTTIPSRNNKSFALYPNPVSHQLILSVENCSIGDYNIRIYNSTGAEVFTCSEKNSFSEFSRIISVTDFPAGLYSIAVQTSGSLNTQNFVVVK